MIPLLLFAGFLHRLGETLSDAAEAFHIMADVMKELERIRVEGW